MTKLLDQHACSRGRSAQSAREAGREGGRQEERPRSGTVTCNKFISHIPIYIYIHVTSQFSPKQQEETHFMDLKIHFDHFSSTKDKSALKMKVPTYIKRGIICCFEMTVFSSSTRHGQASPQPSPVLSACRSFETALQGPQTAQVNFPSGCLNVMQRYILDFPEIKMRCISFKEASMILIFIAELMIRMRQLKKKKMRLHSQPILALLMMQIKSNILRQLGAGVQVCWSFRPHLGKGMVSSYLRPLCQMLSLVQAHWWLEPGASVSNEGPRYLSLKMPIRHYWEQDGAAKRNVPHLCEFLTNN